MSVLLCLEALELVAQLQQQQNSHSSSKMFRIPDGVDFISQDSNSQHRSNSKLSPGVKHFNLSLYQTVSSARDGWIT